jgi:hypothetical protein
LIGASSSVQLTCEEKLETIPVMGKKGKTRAATRVFSEEGNILSGLVAEVMSHLPDGNSNIDAINELLWEIPPCILF